MGRILTSPRPGEPSVKGGLLAAWRRGFDAAQAGKTQDDNPYQDSAGGWGETHRKYWREGWTVGRATPREKVIPQTCRYCGEPAMPESIRCERHRHWIKNQKSDIPTREQARRRRAEMDRTPCATCGTPFRATSHNSKFCSLDHDPGLLYLEERLELVKKYPGCEERWAKKYREMVRRHM